MPKALKARIKSSQDRYWMAVVVNASCEKTGYESGLLLAALGEKNRLRMKHLFLDFLPGIECQREETAQPQRQQFTPGEICNGLAVA